jgi:hypothetical protein
MVKRNVGARRRHDTATAEFRRARYFAIGLFTVVGHRDDRFTSIRDVAG